MNRIITIFIFPIVFSSLSSLAQEEHPIDIKLKQCLAIDSNQTTAGMVNCAIIAEDKWDIELNKYYNLLMNSLGSKGKESLKASQRKWIEYRDNEFNLISTFYYEEMEGTMWYVVATGDRLDLVKKRTLELKVYYDTIEFGF